MLPILIVDQPKGLDYLWILGDTFVKDNVDNFVLRSKRDRSNFMFSNFEVETYGVSCTSTNDVSPLSRVRNVLYKAFAKFNRLPKLIVVIMEDSVLEYLKLNDFGLAEAYQIMFEWLVKEYYRGILSMKEKLPTKASREGYPHVLFVAPTVHNLYANDNRRRKFTLAMEKVARESNKFKNMSVLRLKQVWDPEDRNLYLKFNKMLSEEGFRTYWKALDKSVKYCISRMDEENTNRIVENHKQELERQDQPPRFNYYQAPAATNYNDTWYDRYHYDSRNDSQNY